ncbi:MAG: DUF4258 domain-containing protein [Selenomonadaceae bacterium]|nr:DUF4258 domain-containing protein [Selenomonadaceae bacterium]
MEKNSFEKFCKAGKIHWTDHGLKRIQVRDISRDDVKNCIMNGEIIEEYPDDYPHPSALIFGRKLTGEIIHVVCGLNNEKIHIITAYEPTTEKFMEDLRTRRQK